MPGKLEGSNLEAKLNAVAGPPSESENKVTESKWGFWRILIPKKLFGAIARYLWLGMNQSEVSDQAINSRKTQRVSDKPAPHTYSQEGMEARRKEITGTSELVDGAAIKDQQVHFFQSKATDSDETALKCTFKMGREALNLHTQHAPVNPQQLVDRLRYISQQYNADYATREMSSEHLRTEAYSLIQEYSDQIKLMEWEVSEKKRSPSDLAVMQEYCHEAIDHLKRELGARSYTHTAIQLPEFEPVFTGTSNSGALWKSSGDSYDLEASAHGSLEKDLTLNLNSRDFEMHGCKVSIWMPSTDIPFTLRGKVMIEAPAHLNPDQAKIKIMAVMDTLGIEPSPTSKEQMEESYLDRIAEINGVDSDQEYLGVTKVKDQKQRAKRKAKVLRKKLGVDYSKRNKLYSPGGEVSDGRVVHYRPEILGDPKYPLFERHLVFAHEVYTDSHPGGSVGLLGDIVRFGGQINSAAERMVKGHRVKGQSIGSDMVSGGADYVFTRAATRPNGYGRLRRHGVRLLFKPRLAARLDAISYNSDSDGNATAEHLKKKRLTTVSQLMDTAVNQDVTNETMFKDALSLYSDIENIVVPTEKEREAIIQVFLEQGRTKVDDGRPIEEVVVVGGQVEVPELPEEIRSLAKH